MSGELNGRKVVLVADGPGPRLAGHAADVAGEHVHAESVVTTGFCGGLQPGLGPQTIVVASAILDAAGNVLVETAIPVSRTAGWTPAREKLLSMDRVAISCEEKRTLGKSGAGAVEMEAAAVGSRARQWGAQFYGIRVVTDSVDEQFSIDFNRMRDSDGRFSRSRIIREACHDPFKLFPELMLFDRRCRGAAAVLGDFIADCQF
jgi:nucleoside phosphorylase